MIQASKIINVIEGLENIRPEKVVSDLSALYVTVDFKKAVSQIAKKYKLTPLTVLKLYMKKTGTTFNNLPDGYSLKNFTKTKDASQDDGGDPSSDYGDGYGGEDTEDSSGGKNKKDLDFNFMK
jgi:hypothetical protein